MSAAAATLGERGWRGAEQEDRTRRNCQHS